MNNPNQAPQPKDPNPAHETGKVALGGQVEHIPLTTIVEGTGNPDARPGDVTYAVVDRSNPRGAPHVTDSYTVRGQVEHIPLTTIVEGTGNPDARPGDVSHYKR